MGKFGEGEFNLKEIELGGPSIDSSMEEIVANKVANGAGAVAAESKGHLLAIILGSVGAFVFIVILAIYLLRRKSNAKKSGAPELEPPENPLEQDKPIIKALKKTEELQGEIEKLKIQIKDLSKKQNATKTQIQEIDFDNLNKDEKAIASNIDVIGEQVNGFNFGDLNGQIAEVSKMLQEKEASLENIAAVQMQEIKTKIKDFSDRVNNVKEKLAAVEVNLKQNDENIKALELKISTTDIEAVKEAGDNDIVVNYNSIISEQNSIEEDCKTKRSRIKSIEADLSDLDDKIVKINKSIIEKKQQLNEKKNLLNEKQELQGEIEKLKIQIKDLSKKQNATKTQIQEIDFDNLNKDEKAIASNIDVIGEQVNGFNFGDLNGQIAEVSKMLQEKEASLENIAAVQMQEIKTKIKDFSDRVNNVKEKLAAVEVNLKQNDESIKALELKISTTDIEAVKEAGDNDIVANYGSITLEQNSIKEDCKTKRSRIKSIEADLSDLDDKIVKINKSIIEKKQQLKGKKNLLAKNQELQDEIEKLKIQVESLIERQNVVKAKIQAIDFDNLNKNKETIAIDIAAIELQIKDFVAESDDKLNECGNLVEALKNKRSEFENLKRTIGEVNKKVVEIKNELNEINNETKSCRDTLEQMSKEEKDCVIALEKHVDRAENSEFNQTKLKISELKKSFELIEISTAEDELQLKEKEIKDAGFALKNFEKTTVECLNSLNSKMTECINLAQTKSGAGESSDQIRKFALELEANIKEQQKVRIDQLNREFTELNSDLQNLKKQQNSIQEKIGPVNVNAITANNEAIQEKIANLSNEINDTSLLADWSYDAVDSKQLEEYFNKAEDKFKELEKLIGEIDQGIQQAEAGLVQSKQEMKALTEKSDAMSKNKFEYLKKQPDVTAGEAEQFKSEILEVSNLKEEIERIATELDSTVKNKSEKIKKAENDLSRLKQEYDECKNLFTDKKHAYFDDVFKKTSTTGETVAEVHAEVIAKTKKREEIKKNEQEARRAQLQREFAGLNFDLQDLKKQQNSIQEKIKPVNVNAITANNEAIQEKIADLSNKIGDTSLLADWSYDAVDSKQLEEYFDKAEDKFKELEKLIGEIDQGIQQTEAGLVQPKQEMKELTEKSIKMSKYKSEYLKKQPDVTAEEKEEFKSEILKVNNLKAEIESIATKLGDAITNKSEEVKKAENDLSRLKQKYDECKNLFTDKKRAYSNDVFKKTSTTGTTVAEMHAKVIENTKKREQEAKKQQGARSDQLNRELTELNSGLQNLKKQQNSIQEKIGPVNVNAITVNSEAIKNKIANLSNEINDTSPLADWSYDAVDSDQLKERFSKAEDKFKELEKLIEEIDQGIQQAEAGLVQPKQKMKELTEESVEMSKNKSEHLRKQLNVTNAEKEKFKGEISKIDNLKAEIESIATGLDNAIKNKSEEVKKAENELSQLKRERDQCKNLFENKKRSYSNDVFKKTLTTGKTVAEMHANIIEKTKNREEIKKNEQQRLLKKQADEIKKSHLEKIEKSHTRPGGSAVIHGQSFKGEIDKMLQTAKQMNQKIGILSSNFDKSLKKLEAPRELCVKCAELSDQATRTAASIFACKKEMEQLQAQYSVIVGVEGLAENKENLKILIAKLTEKQSTMRSHLSKFKDLKAESAKIMKSVKDYFESYSELVQALDAMDVELQAKKIFGKVSVSAGLNNLGKNTVEDYNMLAEKFKQFVAQNQYAKNFQAEGMFGEADVGAYLKEFQVYVDSNADVVSSCENNCLPDADNLSMQLNELLAKCTNDEFEARTNEKNFNDVMKEAHLKIFEKLNRDIEQKLQGRAPEKVVKSLAVGNILSQSAKTNEEMKVQQLGDSFETFCKCDSVIEVALYDAVFALNNCEDVLSSNRDEATALTLSKKMELSEKLEKQFVKLENLKSKIIPSIEIWLSESENWPEEAMTEAKSIVEAKTIDYEVSLIKIEVMFQLVKLNGVSGSSSTYQAQKLMEMLNENIDQKYKGLSDPSVGYHDSKLTFKPVDSDVLRELFPEFKTYKFEVGDIPIYSSQISNMGTLFGIAARHINHDENKELYKSFMGYANERIGQLRIALQQKKDDVDAALRYEKEQQRKSDILKSKRLEIKSYLGPTVFQVDDSTDEDERFKAVISKVLGDAQGVYDSFGNVADDEAIESLVVDSIIELDQSSQEQSIEDLCFKYAELSEKITVLLSEIQQNKQTMKELEPFIDTILDSETFLEDVDKNAVGILRFELNSAKDKLFSNLSELEKLKNEASQMKIMNEERLNARINNERVLDMLDVESRVKQCFSSDFSRFQEFLNQPNNENFKLCYESLQSRFEKIKQNNKQVECFGEQRMFSDFDALAYLQQLELCATFAIDYDLCTEEYKLEIEKKLSQISSETQTKNEDDLNWAKTTIKLNMLDKVCAEINNRLNGQEPQDVCAIAKSASMSVRASREYMDIAIANHNIEQSFIKICDALNAAFTSGEIINISALSKTIIDLWDKIIANGERARGLFEALDICSKVHNLGANVCSQIAKLGLVTFAEHPQWAKLNNIFNFTSYSDFEKTSVLDQELKASTEYNFNFGNGNSVLVSILSPINMMDGKGVYVFEDLAKRCLEHQTRMNEYCALLNNAQGYLEERRKKEELLQRQRNAIRSRFTRSQAELRFAQSQWEWDVKQQEMQKKLNAANDAYEKLSSKGGDVAANVKNLIDSQQEKLNVSIVFDDCVVYAQLSIEVENLRGLIEESKRNIDRLQSQIEIVLQTSNLLDTKEDLLILVTELNDKKNVLIKNLDTFDELNSKYETYKEQFEEQLNAHAEIANFLDVIDVESQKKNIFGDRYIASVAQDCNDLETRFIPIRKEVRVEKFKFFRMFGDYDLGAYLQEYSDCVAETSKIAATCGSDYFAQIDKNLVALNSLSANLADGYNTGDKNLEIVNAGIVSNILRNAARQLDILADGIAPETLARAVSTGNATLGLVLNSDLKEKDTYKEITEDNNAMDQCLKKTHDFLNTQDSSISDQLLDKVDENLSQLELLLNEKFDKSAITEKMNEANRLLSARAACFKMRDVRSSTCAQLSNFFDDEGDARKLFDEFDQIKKFDEVFTAGESVLPSVSGGMSYEFDGNSIVICAFGSSSNCYATALRYTEYVSNKDSYMAFVQHARACVEKKRTLLKEERMLSDQVNAIKSHKNSKKNLRSPSDFVRIMTKISSSADKVYEDDPDYQQSILARINDFNEQKKELEALDRDKLVQYVELSAKIKGQRTLVETCEKDVEDLNKLVNVSLDVADIDNDESDLIFLKTQLAQKKATLIGNINTLNSLKAQYLSMMSPEIEQALVERAAIISLLDTTDVEARANDEGFSAASSNRFSSSPSDEIIAKKYEKLKNRFGPIKANSEVFAFRNYIGNGARLQECSDQVIAIDGVIDDCEKKCISKIDVALSELEKKISQNVNKSGDTLKAPSDEELKAVKKTIISKKLRKTRKLMASKAGLKKEDEAIENNKKKLTAQGQAKLEKIAELSTDGYKRLPSHPNYHDPAAQQPEGAEESAKWQEYKKINRDNYNIEQSLLFIHRFLTTYKTAIPSRSELSECQSAIGTLKNLLAKNSGQIANEFIAKKNIAKELINKMDICREVRDLKKDSEHQLAEICGAQWQALADEDDVEQVDKINRPLDKCNRMKLLPSWSRFTNYYPTSNSSEALRIYSHSDFITHQQALYSVCKRYIEHTERENKYDALIKEAEARVSDLDRSAERKIERDSKKYQQKVELDHIFRIDECPFPESFLKNMLGHKFIQGSKYIASRQTAIKELKQTTREIVAFNELIGDMEYIDSIILAAGQSRILKEEQQQNEEKVLFDEQLTTLKAQLQENKSQESSEQIKQMLKQLDKRRQRLQSLWSIRKGYWDGANTKEDYGLILARDMLERKLLQLKLIKIKKELKLDWAASRDIEILSLWSIEYELRQSSKRAEKLEPLKAKLPELKACDERWQQLSIEELQQELQAEVQSQKQLLLQKLNEQARQNTADEMKKQEELQEELQKKWQTTQKYQKLIEQIAAQPEKWQSQSEKIYNARREVPRSAYSKLWSWKKYKELCKLKELQQQLQDLEMQGIRTIETSWQQLSRQEQLSKQLESSAANVEGKLKTIQGSLQQQLQDLQQQLQSLQQPTTEEKTTEEKTAEGETTEEGIIGKAQLQQLQALKRLRESLLAQLSGVFLSEQFAIGIDKVQQEIESLLRRQILTLVLPKLTDIDKLLNDPWLSKQQKKELLSGLSTTILPPLFTISTQLKSELLTEQKKQTQELRTKIEQVEDKIQKLPKLYQQKLEGQTLQDNIQWLQNHYDFEESLLLKNEEIEEMHLKLEDFRQKDKKYESMSELSLVQELLKEQKGSYIIERAASGIESDCFGDPLYYFGDAKVGKLSERMRKLQEELEEQKKELAKNTDIDMNELNKFVKEEVLKEKMSEKLDLEIKLRELQNQMVKLEEDGTRECSNLLRFIKEAQTELQALQDQMNELGKSESEKRSEQERLVARKRKILQELQQQMGELEASKSKECLAQRGLIEQKQKELQVLQQTMDDAKKLESTALLEKLSPIKKEQKEALQKLQEQTKNLKGLRLQNDDADELLLQEQIESLQQTCTEIENEKTMIDKMLSDLEPKVATDKSAASDRRDARKACMQQLLNERQQLLNEQTEVFAEREQLLNEQKVAKVIVTSEEEKNNQDEVKKEEELKDLQKLTTKELKDLSIKLKKMDSEELQEFEHLAILYDFDLDLKSEKPGLGLLQLFKKLKAKSVEELNELKLLAELQEMEPLERFIKFNKRRDSHTKELKKLAELVKTELNEDLTLEQLTASLQGFNERAAELANVPAELKALDNRIKQLDNLPAKLKEWDEEKKELENLKALLKKLEAKDLSALKELGKLAALFGMVPELAQALKFEKQQANLENEFNALEAEIQQKTNQLASVATELRTLSTAKQEKDDQMAAWQLKWDELCARTGNLKRMTEADNTEKAQEESEYYALQPAQEALKTQIQQKEEERANLESGLNALKNLKKLLDKLQSMPPEELQELADKAKLQKMDPNKLQRIEEKQRTLLFQLQRMKEGEDARFKSTQWRIKQLKRLKKLEDEKSKLLERAQKIEQIDSQIDGLKEFDLTARKADKLAKVTAELQALKSKKQQANLENEFNVLEAEIQQKTNQLASVATELRTLSTAKQEKDDQMAAWQLKWDELCARTGNLKRMTEADNTEKAQEESEYYALQPAQEALKTQIQQKEEERANLESELKALETQKQQNEAEQAKLIRKSELQELETLKKIKGLKIVKDQIFQLECRVQRAEQLPKVKKDLQKLSAEKQELLNAQRKLLADKTKQLANLTKDMKERERTVNVLLLLQLRLKTLKELDQKKTLHLKSNMDGMYRHTLLFEELVEIMVQLRWLKEQTQCWEILQRWQILTETRTKECQDNQKTYEQQLENLKQQLEEQTQALSQLQPPEIVKKDSQIVEFSPESQVLVGQQVIPFVK